MVRLLAIFILLIPARGLEAQGFLECRKSDSLRSSSEYTSDDALRTEWSRELRGLLHALGGDDLRAAFGAVPSLEIVRGEQPNAFSLPPSRLVFSSALLNEARSTGELAFVVAHETAHLTLGHLHGAPLMAVREGDAMSRKAELDADAVAAHLVTRAGFRVEDGIRLLERIADTPERRAAVGSRLERLAALSETLENSAP